MDSKHTDGMGEGEDNSKSSTRWNWLNRSPADTGPNATQEEAAPDDLFDETSIPNDLHDVVRQTDEWFERRFQPLQLEAADLAREWAHAGLPRPEVSYEYLPPEKTLTERSHALFVGWVDRTIRRVNGAIQGCVKRAGGHITAYEHQLNTVERTGLEIGHITAEIARVEERMSGQESHITLRSFMGWGFWVLIVLLIFVDWVANVPVFHELLPQDPGSEQVLRRLIAGTENHAVTGGVRRLGLRTFFSIDVSLLALGVIASLVFLSDVFGNAMRRLKTLRPEYFPWAVRAVESERRQFLFAARWSAVGVIILLAVLAGARATLAPVTQKRVEASEAEIKRLEEDSRKATGFDEVAEVQQKLKAASRLREYRIQRHDYAATIAAMNWPILALNLVVAITAALAAYLKCKDSISGAFEDPRLRSLRRKVLELRQQSVGLRTELSGTEAQIMSEFTTADHLLMGRPFESSSAKANKLRSTVELFRTTNAQIRGIDPANIVSFRTPVVLELSVNGAQSYIEAPSDLMLHKTRFDVLRNRCVGVFASLNADTKSSLVLNHD